MARGKEILVEEGIYRSVSTGRYRIKVSVVIQGKRVYPTGQTTFHRDTPLARVREQKFALLAQLQKLVVTGGGAAEKGTFSGLVAEYWKRQTLSPARKEQVERLLPFWVEHFGTKTPEWLVTHVADLKAALATIVRKPDGKPIALAYKDHFVAALSNVYTVMHGEDAPNPGKKIGVFAETDPRKLPRKDVPYFLIDCILAQLHDTWKGKVSRSKLWLRCAAYGGVTFAQLEKMAPDDFFPRSREIIPARREKGAGAVTNRRELIDEGVEAFLDFDRHAQWGTTQPRLDETFPGARDRALAYLQAHPEVIPADVRIDFKRASKMTYYWLRHSFGCEVLRQTRSDRVASQYLGHASTRQIGRYVQGVISDQLEAAGGVLRAGFRARPKLTLVSPTKPERRRRSAA
jgi:integrase